MKSESETLFNNRDDIKSVEFSDFKIIKVLGMGAFGKVKEKIKLGVLSRIHKDWRIICDENLKKDVLIYQDMVSNTILEKKILSSIDNVFLLKLNFCFQTKDKIYFVMPFMRSDKSNLGAVNYFQS